MPQGNLFKGRDRRNKGWFWMDNDYLNGYAKIFGAVGTAIYVSLCRHADNETQRCFPAMELMAEELGTSRNTISKYIKLFEKHHLLSIEKERNPRTKKWLNNIYTLLDKTEWDSHAQILGMGESHAQLTNEPCTTDDESHAQPLGNKETHINKTHIRKAEQAPLVAEVIKLFEEVNPACKRMYGNTTQRKAASHLLEQYGFEQVKKVIAILPKSNLIAYLPTITTPLQLQDKWASLEAGLLKEKNKNKKDYKVAF